MDRVKFSQEVCGESALFHQFLPGRGGLLRVEDPPVDSHEIKKSRNDYRWMILLLLFCLLGFSLPYLDRILINNDFSKVRKSRKRGWNDRLQRYSDLRVSGELEISHFFFKLTTERFNRRLTSIGHRFSSFSGLFYRIGTCFVLVLSALSIPFLLFQERVHLEH